MYNYVIGDKFNLYMYMQLLYELGDDVSISEGSFMRTKHICVFTSEHSKAVLLMRIHFIFVYAKAVLSVLAAL